MRRSTALALSLVPFALGTYALRQAVAPIGDSVAASLVVRTPSTWEREGPRPLVLPTDSATSDGFWIPFPTVPPTKDRSLVPPGDRSLVPSGDRSLVPSGDRSLVPGTKERSAVAGTIGVPAAAVARAMARRDVGAVNAVDADGAPIGASLRGVGRYGVGLRDGDVVVSVAGTPTPNVGAMVGAATAAAQSGASRISGQIVRDGARINVVLELPK